jgi:cytoskeletal protein RodZ
VERKKNGLELDPVLQKEVKEIGDILRQKRKQMNISLKEAENATSIRMVYLQALEEGEMEKLISPVYAQGFFKQYASFLGIDGESITREKPYIFNRAETQEFAYGIGTLEVRGNPGASVKWFPNAMWVLAFIGVALVAWYVAKFAGVL